MAYSPSPPTTVQPADSFSNRPSPPPVPTISKREKRRNQLAERLNDTTTQFAQNRDQHYRSQLQALQIDMQLITKADLSGIEPLQDGEEIHELVKAQLGIREGSNAPSFSNGLGPNQRRPENETAALAGRRYAEFVEKVGNAAEERDTHMTMLYVSLNLLLFKP
jgi:Sds3-like